jgi:hypothetical protein
MDTRLLGIWDSDTDEQYAKFRLYFLDSGDLTLTIFTAGKVDQVIKMTYAVDGNILTTKQSSPSREDRIEFAIERDGGLTVRNGWLVCRYHRIP